MIPYILGAMPEPMPAVDVHIDVSVPYGAPLHATAPLPYAYDVYDDLLDLLPMPGVAEPAMPHPARPAGDGPLAIAPQAAPPAFARINPFESPLATAGSPSSRRIHATPDVPSGSSASRGMGDRIGEAGIGERQTGPVPIAEAAYAPSYICPTCGGMIGR